MLIDTVFTQWQGVAGIGEHVEGLAPGEVERLQSLLEALVREPARARHRLSEVPDEDCAEVSWLLLHTILREELPPGMAAGPIDWAELACEHSGLQHSQRSVLRGHIKLCRGWAHAGTDRNAAQLAFEEAEAEYRDARARPALRGLAVCVLRALDLQTGRIDPEDEEAAGRWQAGFDLIRSDDGCEGVAAAVQAAFDRALEQWRWADAVVTAAEPEREAAAPGALLDLQLFGFLQRRAIRAMMRGERSAAELFRVGEIVEAIAVEVGKPADFLSSAIGYFFHEKRLDRAEGLLRARLARYPDDREAIEACASALHMQAKLDEAAKLLREGLERFPDDAELLSILAVVLYEKGDLDGAAGVVRHALQIDPENPRARMVEQALSRVPADVDEDALALGGDWDNLSREDVEAELHLRRAEELFGQARFEEAVAAYEAATQANPDLAYAYMGQGDAYYRTGKYFQAIAFFQESLTLEPAAPTYRFMADSLRQVGKRASAREAYEKALELNPGYGTARASLQELLAETGERKGAAGRPGALPPVPQLVDPAPYHVFNLPEAPLPEHLVRAGDAEDTQAASTPGREVPSPPEPLPVQPAAAAPAQENRSEAGPSRSGPPPARLSPDELIERMEEKSFPGLRALLALCSLPEQLRRVEEMYPPAAYRRLVMMLQAPLFFLQNREKRLDEALRLALLVHGIAQLLPAEWPPDEDLGPARVRSDAAYGLASVYLDRGEVAQGLEHLHEAERWYEEEREERRRRGLSGPSLFDRIFAGGADPGARLFRKLSEIYSVLGDEEKARAYALRAGQGEEPLPGPDQRFDELLSQALFFMDQGEYDKALAALDEAVPLAVDGSEIVPRKLTSLCHTSGRLMTRMRLFRTALRYLGRALEINTLRQRQSQRLEDLLACGEIHEQRPDLGDATATYEAALGCVSEDARAGDRHAWRDGSGKAWRVIDPEDAWPALLALARALEARGDLVRAAGFLELALDLGEQVRVQVARPEHRIALQAQRVGAYEDLARIEIRLAEERPGDADEHRRRAWSVMERARGRAFVELLGSSPLGLPADAPAGLVEREAALRRRLDELSHQETGRIWEAYETTLEQLETVWRDLAAASPRSADYVELRQGMPIGFDEVRELLSNRETV